MEKWCPKATSLGSGKAQIWVCVCLTEKSTFFTLYRPINVFFHFANRKMATNQWFLFSPPALSSSKGEFLLNGDFVVTMSKREIRIGNAVIEYSGSDNVVERINSSGRIEQELLLQVKTWPWAHAPFLIPWVARPTSILSIFSVHSRYCRWESYTTPMCAILSIFLLKTNPSSFTGTVMDPGKHAANPAKVSTFRLSSGDLTWFLILLFLSFCGGSQMYVIYTFFYLHPFSNLSLPLSGYFGLASWTM